MEMMNRAIEDAADFRGMMGKIEADAAQRAGLLRLALESRGSEPDRGESVEHNPLPEHMQRQRGENRAMHRARLKRERRSAKAG